MNRQQHWNQVYDTKDPQNVSWYQNRPELSLSPIADSGINKNSGIIDVGGGMSILVDCLLDLGYTQLAVLDISASALNKSRERLGNRSSSVEWFQADVTIFDPPHRFGLWHDRAVFHFLTDANDREGYITTLRRTLEPGGTVILATFDVIGPPKCSGLNVIRYDEKSIVKEFGTEFVLQDVRRETHITPSKSEQSFIYFRFQR